MQYRANKITAIKAMKDKAVLPKAPNITWSVHVVVLQKTAEKCTKRSCIARAKLLYY